MECVIVSDAKNEYLRQLTVEAIITSGVNCIVVEKQPVEYECTTVHYDFDFNYNRCLNLGYKHTHSEAICFCNNDVIFYPNWTESERYLKDYGSLSLLNPGWMFHKDFHQGVHEGYRTGLELCGWALIVSRKTMEITGGFDEGVKFWTSDDLWRTQLQYHNIKHALIADYKIKHLTSKTLGSGLTRDKFIEYTSGQVAPHHKAIKKYEVRNDR